MADFRNIHTRIWTDSWFCELKPDEKLVFVYLFSNPNASVCGMYEMPKRNIAMDTGLSAERVSEILDNFSVSGKVFWENGIVWVVNLKKYNDSGQSPKVQSRINKDLEAISDCPLKRQYYTKNQIPYPESQIPYPEKVSETETETETDRDRKETETNNLPSPYLSILESVTGIPGSAGAVEALNQFEEMKPLQEDIEAAYKWLKDQNKAIKYYGQLVGPTRTAMSKRVGEGWKRPSGAIDDDERLRQQQRALYGSK